MKLALIDWGIIALVIISILAIGLWAKGRASKDSSSFFLASRGMPWWLLGTSMVATTFATDTPNLVTGLVRGNGIAGNWVWWSFLITGMLTAFIYSKLWRRLGITTDIEFYERRYSGPMAGFLRGFRAVYLGLFFNVMIMATVTLAAIKFGNVLFGISPVTMILFAGTITVIFSAAGGLLGVLVTDLILFAVSMTGAVLAAIYALGHPSVGGLETMLQHPRVAENLSFLPDFTDPAQFVPLMLIPLAVQWWSAWYPGSEPGGGGYAAQRMLAAKNERHAVAAVVFFNFAHYALRPWPWILVALASMIVFPDLASLKTALPNVDVSLLKDDLAYPAMLSYLPHGVLGIVVASLMAAYVSTISTHLNWGASYLVNDVYVRFAAPNASEKQQVLMGRLFTVGLMVLASLFALALESAMQAFNLLLSIGAGTGLLFFLRWFWTRINAWSELTAMVLSFLVSIYLQFWGPEGLVDWQRFLLTVAITTTSWVAVTLLTPRTPADQLDKFYADIAGDGTDYRRSAMADDIRGGILSALWATAAVYAVLFGTGLVLYGDYALGAICAAIALLGIWRTVHAIRNVEITVDPHHTANSGFADDWQLTLKPGE